MTNKEAANIIKEHRFDITYQMNSVTPLTNALNMAIKALEQQPCEDAISRQALLQKCVYAPIAPILKSDSVHYEDVVFAKDIINAEPSISICTDAISRQAVLDLIEHYNSDGLGSVFYGYEEGVKFADAVNKLPPVSTEKTGRWITTRTFMHDGEYYCSKCKCDSPRNERWDYCPNCGARMDGENV